jgi:hypothetical protein
MITGDHEWLGALISGSRARWRSAFPTLSFNTSLSRVNLHKTKSSRCSKTAEKTADNQKKTKIDVEKKREDIALIRQ